MLKVIALDRCRRLHIANHISENVRMETIHEKAARLLIIEDEDLYRAGCPLFALPVETFVFICKSRYEFSGRCCRYLRVTESAVSECLPILNVE